MDNNFIKEVIIDDIHYCTLVKPTLSAEGLNFITSDDKTIQVGIWNYKKNKELEPHYHNDYERNADITGESVFVSKGKILIKVYKKNKELIDLIINLDELIIYDTIGILSDAEIEILSSKHIVKVLGRGDL